MSAVREREDGQKLLPGHFHRGFVCCSWAQLRRPCLPADPHRVLGLDCGCWELLWCLARAEPFSLACQQSLALLVGGLAQEHSKDHVGLPTLFRAAAQGWSDCSLWFLSC